MIRKLGLCLSLCLVLLGCRSEEEIVQKQESQEVVKKLKFFEQYEKNRKLGKGKDLPPLPFSQSLKAYIIEHPEVGIQVEKLYGKLGSRIVSPIFKDEKTGREMVLFPIVKEFNTIAVLVSIVNKEKTNLYFYPLLKGKNKVADEIIELFQKEIDIIKEKRKLQKICPKDTDGFLGNCDKEKDIDEITIINFGNYKEKTMASIELMFNGGENNSPPSLIEDMSIDFYLFGFGGGGYSPPPKPEKGDPCTQTKEGKKEAEKILKDANVAQHMDSFLRGKVASAREWAVAIGRNNDGSYSVSEPNMGGATSGVVPSVPSGVYVADGHTHPGSSGAPSGGDLYGMLEIMQSNPDYTTRFVYGDYFGSEVYALVITDRNLARQFLSQYPRSSNYDENSHEFLANTPLGIDFQKIERIRYNGYYNYSQVQGYSPAAIGMAYILEKYNTGLALLKQDINGNFQPFRINDQEIKTFDGMIKPGVNITPCP